MAKWLVDEWNKAHKMWSLWWAGLMIAGPELVYRIAEASYAILPMLSVEVRDYLPEIVRKALALAGSGFVFFRLVKQRGLKKSELNLPQDT